MKKPCASVEVEFVRLAVAHLDLLNARDVNGSNRAHKQLNKLAKSIRESRDSGLALLSRLLRHENESVQAWAAYFLLPIDKLQAENALSRLAKNARDWIIQSDAEQTLTEWNAGRLDTDWFMK